MRDTALWETAVLKCTWSDAPELFGPARSDGRRQILHGKLVRTKSYFMHMLISDSVYSDSVYSDSEAPAMLAGQEDGLADIEPALLTVAAPAQEPATTQAAQRPDKCSGFKAVTFYRLPVVHWTLLERRGLPGRNPPQQRTLRQCTTQELTDPCTDCCGANTVSYFAILASVL